MARLAASAHTDIVAVAKPHIEALARQLRETVDLSVERGGYAICIDHFPSDQELRVISSVGTAFPLHCTAHGKAMLASMTDQALKVILSRPLEQRTQKTILDSKLLMEQINMIRKSHRGFDLEEHADEVCGVGVTLGIPFLERYAVSIAAPALRFHKNRETFETAIMRCKAAIEAAVGPKKR